MMIELLYYNNFQRLSGVSSYEKHSALYFSMQIGCQILSPLIFVTLFFQLQEKQRLAAIIIGFSCNSRFLTLVVVLSVLYFFCETVFPDSVYVFVLALYFLVRLIAGFTSATNN